MALLWCCVPWEGTHIGHGLGHLLVTICPFSGCIETSSFEEEDPSLDNEKKVSNLTLSVPYTGNPL